MNAKQKSQVLSKSNISQLREVDDVKGGKVERNFLQSTSVGVVDHPTQLICIWICYLLQRKKT